jgi:predicted Fe-S protein YdhL (DUF1289 family)
MNQPLSNKSLFRPSLAATTSTVPSPCVSVCRMNPGTGFCEGCWRTIDEIAAWSQLDDQAKQAILVRLDERMFGERAGSESR